MVENARSEDEQRTTTLTILGSGVKMRQPETGFDTVILIVPEELATAPPETPGANPHLGIYLAGVAEEQAMRMRESLRMSGWWITRDPEVVKQRGLAHDCTTCRAGVDQALAHMREHPDAVMAVGQLSWCQP